MLKISPNWIKERMDTSDQGLSHPLQDLGAEANDLIGMKNTLVKRLFTLTLSPPNLFKILAHPVCKMWIIHEPKNVALWNKRHFEEKSTENVQHV